MTTDRIKGKGKEAMGEAKERVARVTDNEELEAEGSADKAEGKAQGVVGKAKEKLNDVKDEVKKRAS